MPHPETRRAWVFPVVCCVAELEPVQVENELNINIFQSAGREWIVRKRELISLIFLLLVLGFASPLRAQSSTSVQYVYDSLGRLTTVIDPSGNVATYNYDAVGNLSSITRSTVPPTSLAIFSFSPTQGGVGQAVAIQGQNFSTTVSANTVKFNGTTAAVTAATANSLTVTVPAGATSGAISVTVGTATSTSSSSFTVLNSPAITSVNPTSTLNTPTISNFQVTGGWRGD